MRAVPQASVWALKNSKVLAIRHAESVSNIVSQKYGVFAERLYPGIIDAELSDEGIKQCVAQQNLANQLDIPVVLVSPLRRTITTAYYIFKEHPNFGKMKFVLAPLAREALLGAGDIPLNLDDVVN